MLDSFKPLIKKRKKRKEGIDRNTGRQNPRVGMGEALDQKFPFYLQESETVSVLQWLASCSSGYSVMQAIYIYIIYI